MGLNGTEMLMIATRKAFELEISQSAVAGQVPLSQWLTDLMVIYMYQACHILDPGRDVIPSPDQFRTEWRQVITEVGYTQSEPFV